MRSRVSFLADLLANLDAKSVSQFRRVHPRSLHHRLNGRLELPSVNTSTEYFASSGYSISLQ